MYWHDRTNAKRISRFSSGFLIDYDVKINYPYCGSMIPDKFVGNSDVFPIMIEVNKKLYLNNEDDFNKIKIVINQLLGVIAEYEDSFE